MLNHEYWNMECTRTMTIGTRNVYVSLHDLTLWWRGVCGLMMLRAIPNRFNHIGQAEFEDTDQLDQGQDRRHQGGSPTAYQRVQWANPLLILKLNRFREMYEATPDSRTDLMFTTNAWKRTMNIGTWNVQSVRRNIYMLSI